MRVARAGGLAVVAVLVVAAAASAAAPKTAAPKNVKGTTYVDSQYGFAVTVPTTWRLVPRTVAGVRAYVAKYKKAKSTVNLADAYASIIATAAGRKQVTSYKFQAFDWPGDYGATPILTMCYVGVVKNGKVMTKADLPSIGAVFANSLAANKGSKIVDPKEVTLRYAGPAEYITGIIPAGGGVASGFDLYLIPHGKTLYELGFQIDSTLLANATLFATMAKDFRIA